jgi:XTP/dITP diphosphohydrolase
MRILVATRSAGKQRELQRLFSGTGIEVTFPDDAGILPSAEEDLLEVHDSFEANARHKAEYFARKTSLPTVADDSGLEVFALGGAPGTRSKRFSGEQGPPDLVDEANNDELLRRLAGAPLKRRKARYRCVLVYLPRPDAVPKQFEGACTGHILEERHGEEGFGYDPLFHSDDLDKPFGEASAEEKDGVSHRGRAFRALRDYLAEPGQ